MLPLVASLGWLPARDARGFDARGGQFLGFSDLSGFRASPGGATGSVAWTSLPITARIDWTELIASWNAATPDGSWLQVEVRAIRPERPTKFYVLGLWSANTNQHPRESVLNQKDADGDVATDTLRLAQPARRFQVRLTLGGDAGELPRVKFLGICLLDATARPGALPPNRVAWGKLLDVPERSQMAYPGGNVWCSPATTSMLLAHWAQVLHRPELDCSVPRVVAGVFDRNWDGTGNWVFNTAFAGSFPGLRAYVARFSDLSEVEDWIARGLPVGLSLCYNKLRGKEGPLSGHLVVCVGFTKEGGVILNDPGTREQVRKVFPRDNVIAAWATSRNAVYLVYPEQAKLPKDRFGHWDSPASRRRIVLGD